MAQAPTITAAIPLASSVEKWSKFEVKLGITANWANPYNYDEIRVSAVFTAPDGQTSTVDGFFMQDYVLANPQTGSLSLSGNGNFKVRFSPNQTGAWKYTLSCTNSAGTGTFPEQTFQVLPASSPKNKGFVRSNQTNYLNLDSGEQLIPVGENIGWQNSNPYVDFNNWLTALSDNGGNFFRLWQCSWGLGIEWKNGTSGYAGLRQYKQTSGFYQDWMFDFCADRGIYIQLCLHNHGQVSTQVNPEWSNSPYNSANGGPCANTWDFFTNTSAKNHVKNRLRYIVARWGYARSILNWELFNEVDWTDQFEQRKNDVANWHLEMAAYLKQIDPYKHLVSSSYANDFNDPQLWNQPDIDFTQTHYYINTANLERALVSGARKYLSDFDKPTLNGEFGLSGSGDQLGTQDPNGIHFHNALWATMFGGAMGTGMTWWWDNYIAPKNLYYHFSPLSNVAALIPFKDASFQPANAAVSGAPADLLLQPTQSWGALSDTSFTIVNGVVIPAGASLGQFLYGSQWNTQFKRPPVFYVNYPASGTFKVKTASETGQTPKIAIWLDGVKLLETDALVNQTYSISVPAGQHTIKVDNTGTDWITISSYAFSGLGNGVDAYVLKSANQDKLTGWLLSNRYNHEYVAANGIPVAVSGAMLTVPNIANGNYAIRYYNCLTGALAATNAVVVSNGILSLALPTLLWDMAFVLEKQSVGVPAIAQAVDFKVSPNPAVPGATLVLELPKLTNTAIQVHLLDLSGRVLNTIFDGLAQEQFSVSLPIDLPSGFYWVKVDGGQGLAMVKGLVISGS